MIRRIEIIGEAAVHLTEETRKAIPELPFRKMRGMRNMVALTTPTWIKDHVRDVATVHVSEVASVLEKFFATTGGTSGTPPA